MLSLLLGRRVAQAGLPKTELAQTNKYWCGLNPDSRINPPSSAVTWHSGRLVKGPGHICKPRNIWKDVILSDIDHVLLARLYKSV